MSLIKRRHFLQFAGSVLCTLPLSQLNIIQQGKKYSQAVAQNTGRKYALLVGINKYSNGTDSLQGCENDVRLQQQLLIHRFGFKAEDIKILIDDAATRQGILTTFEEHLINKAVPGDVVVFHFSGHGSRVSDPDKDTEDGITSSLVPFDSGLRSQVPSGEIVPRGGNVVQDIMGHTLFLLMSALKTDNVTVVLDSCYSGGAKRGNMVVRSCEGGDNYKVSASEFEYQQRWLNKLKLSKQEFINLRRKGVAKGVVIASAKRDQFAVDAPFDDFHAGAFTYFLTQYLWQQAVNESPTTILSNVGRGIETFSRQKGFIQNPELESNIQKPTNTPLYFTPFSSSYAEAVVTKTEGNKVELWLGGIDSQSLAAFNQNSFFTVVDTKGVSKGVVRLDSRTGLIGTGTLVSSTNNVQLQPGTILQERIRGVKSDVKLNIGLDDTFDANTTTQATQALNSLNRIVPLPLRQKEVQYIFGRLTETRYKQLSNKRKNLSVGSFGLFLPTLDEIVPETFGSANESVTDAVQRLKPKFKSLLAAHIIKQILGNNDTSLLKVTASMNIAGSKVVSETLPTRGISKTGASSTPSKVVNTAVGAVPKLPIGTQVAFQVKNQESQPIYISIIVIDTAGEMSVIFPFDWSAPVETAFLDAGENRVIPGAQDAFKLTVSPPTGISEALIVASTSPLRNSLQAIKQVALSRGSTQKSPISATDEFLDVTDKLLSDLDTATRGGMSKGIQLPEGVRGVDTAKLAAMTISFEVVS